VKVISGHLLVLTPDTMKVQVAIAMSPAKTRTEYLQNKKFKLYCFVRLLGYNIIFPYELRRSCINRPYVPEENKWFEFGYL
jgi:hypothetical protein